MEDLRGTVKRQGWAIIKATLELDDLLQLAQSLGETVAHPNGELVRTIRPTEKSSARSRTLSARFGKGYLPFHTDTAFWPLPARFVILSIVGKSACPTLVCPFERALSPASSSSSQSAQQSKWALITPRVSRYCSMGLWDGIDTGLRFDPVCMFPANRQARDVAKLLSYEALVPIAVQIDWSQTGALILDNWQTLHARQNS